MTPVDMIFFISGSISGFISGVYLFLQSIKHKRERLLLLFVSALVLWIAILYGLVASGILLMTQYGVYARPIIFVLLFSPTWLWIITKDSMGRRNIK
jgi:hypothetical protein